MEKRSMKTVTKLILMTVGILALAAGCENTAGIPARVPVMINQNQLTEKAETIIKRSLRHPNPKVRVYAIEASTQLDEKQVNEKLTEMLFDAYVPVRFSAAVALGDKKYEPAVEKLTKILEDDDKNVRIAAAYALDMINHSQGHQLIIKKAIKNNDMKIRANAVMLLGKYGDPSAKEPLKWALNDRNSDGKVKFQAVEALAKLGDESVYQKIWTLLISAFADDRVMGIKAMSALGTARARESIMTMLNDEVLQVRLVAAGELAKFGNYMGKDIISNVFNPDTLNNSEDETVRLTKVLAAVALGNFCDSHMNDELSQLLNDEAEAIRLAAARSVLKCQHVQ